MSNRKRPSNEAREEIQEKIRKLQEELNSYDDESKECDDAASNGGLEGASMHEGKMFFGLRASL